MLGNKVTIEGQADTYYKRRILDKAIDDREQWCMKHCFGEYEFEWNSLPRASGFAFHYTFNKAQDAIMFKLIWG